jgi:hypothetical protein
MTECREHQQEIPQKYWESKHTADVVLEALAQQLDLATFVRVAVVDRAQLLELRVLGANMLGGVRPHVLQAVGETVHHRDSCWNAVGLKQMFVCVTEQIVGSRAAMVLEMIAAEMEAQCYISNCYLQSS